MEFSGLAWHMLRGGRPLNLRSGQEEAALAILGIDEEYDRVPKEIIEFYQETRDSEQEIWAHEIIQVVHQTCANEVDLYIIGEILVVYGAVDFRKEVFVTSNRYRSEQKERVDHAFGEAMLLGVHSLALFAIRNRTIAVFEPFFTLRIRLLSPLQFSLLASDPRIISRVFDAFSSQHPTEPL